MVEYDIGQGTLAITAADATHSAGIHGATIGLEVVESRRGAVLLADQSPCRSSKAPFDSPVCRGCIIRDPDENEIILHARK